MIFKNSHTSAVPTSATSVTTSKPTSAMCTSIVPTTSGTTATSSSYTTAAAQQQPLPAAAQLVGPLGRWALYFYCYYLYYY